MKSLKSLIQEHGMAAHNDMIWQLMRPSIHLQRTPTSQSSIAPGASRLGGLPHLAKGAEWPLWNDEPLAHIATINLADLPAIETDTPLPTSGLLRFWYAHGCAPWGFDPKEKGFFRVTFEPVPHSDTALAPFPIERVSPKNLSDLYAGGAYSPSLLQFISQPTLPYGDWIDQFAPHASVLDDTESYTSLVTDLHAAQQPQHRLLGHPSPQQGTMELECQLVTNGLYCGDTSGYSDPRRKLLEPSASEWRLLLQIDTDEEGPGWMWGDMGMIYFWIRKSDLAQRDFSACWMILQCG